LGGKKARFIFAAILRYTIKKALNH